MSEVKKVLTYLDSLDIRYSIGREELHTLSPYRVSSVLLKDTQGAVLATLPTDKGIDLRAIRKITHRKLEFASVDEIATACDGVSTSYLPPMGGVWGIPTLVENCLFSWPYIEFSLSRDFVVRIEEVYFSRLFPGRNGFHFSHDKHADDNGRQCDEINDERVSHLLNEIEGKKGFSKLFNEQSLTSRLENTKALPVMPGIVHQLMRLLGNPDSNINDLIEIIEQDQALVARIISLSRSAHYAYKGNVANVFDAVYRVIGYEDTLRIAIAMIFSRQLSGPIDGRVGLKVLWVEAMTVATHARYVATNSALGQYLNPGVMYVAALLHNLGYLALAHLFPREYAIFNRLVSSMTDTRLSELENNLSEVSPQKVTESVLSTWGLPSEVIAVASVEEDVGKKSNHQAYRDCFIVARYLVGVENPEDQLPAVIRTLSDRYTLDIGGLIEDINREHLAAEIPFFVDMMLA